MVYPGGKNGSGVYQKIINLMPPHQTYIELFLGSGAIMRNKRPSKYSYGVDIDEDVINRFSPIVDTDLTLIIMNAIEFLELPNIKPNKQTLIYCDPPYLMSTRSSQRQLYRYEMGDEESHLKLLAILKTLPCMVMISGYMSDLYARELAAWRLVTFQAMTRGGTMATECVWCNFPEPFELHDYRYLGGDYRERERIKRKKVRWLARLKQMESQERYALLEVLTDLRSSAPSSMAVTAGNDESSEVTR